MGLMREGNDFTSMGWQSIYLANNWGKTLISHALKLVFTPLAIYTEPTFKSVLRFYFD